MSREPKRTPKQTPQSQSGKIAAYIAKWLTRGYPHIPEEAPPRLEEIGKAPSYRLICQAILSNDVCLTSLGYSRPQTPAYMALKRAELDERLRRNAEQAEDDLR